MASKDVLSEEQTAEKSEDLESVITRSFLNLDRIDVDFYRSKTLWQPFGGRAVFGGQVVGQALAAASYSVPSEQHTHSLHCYFLRPGNVKIPILYSVDRTRDGNTYSSRSIKAMQEGKAIFTMQASFKSEELDPLQHQFTMPVVPSPHECLSTIELLERAVGKEKAAEYLAQINKMSENFMSILRRPTSPDYYCHSSVPAHQYIWIRAAGHLGDDHKMHQCCAAYMSDSMLLGTALLPFSKGFNNRPSVFMTSIDHAVWFHSTFRADDWLLYEMESPVCRDGRAFVNGRMWTQDGRLVISVAQEGVTRTRRRKVLSSGLDKSKL